VYNSCRFLWRERERQRDRETEREQDFIIIISLFYYFDLFIFQDFRLAGVAGDELSERTITSIKTISKKNIKKKYQCA